MGRRVRAVVSATAAAMLLASAATTVAAHPARRAASPQKGGTLVIALTPQANINWYFPYRNNQNDTIYNGTAIGLMYEPLLYIDDHYNIAWKQSLASNVTYNASGTVYHVFLNKNDRWSNGSPITSADAQFGWQVLLATEAAHAAAPWPNSELGNGGLPGNAKSFVVNSPDEFTITLKKPVNQLWFLYNGLDGLEVLPRQAWDKYPTDMTREIAYLGANATNPRFETVVSGPFMMQSATQDQSWVFVPNPNFSGHKPYVSRLILQYEGSDAAEFAALKTGQVQIGYLPTADYSARSQLPDRLYVEYPFDFGFTWLNMNPNAQNGVNKIFDNLYVRQAMQMGIDQAAMIKAAFHGFGAPQYGPIPQNPRTIFFDPKLSKPLYPFNPQAGKKLLEAHGWRESGGVMTKGGKQLSFTMAYPSGAVAWEYVAEILQQKWAAEGIKVTLNPMPIGSEIGLVGNPAKWEVATGIYWYYGGTYPSGEQMFFKDQSFDHQGWNNPQENRLIQLRRGTGSRQGGEPHAAVQLRGIHVEEPRRPVDAERGRSRRGGQQRPRLQPVHRGPRNRRVPPPVLVDQ